MDQKLDSNELKLIRAFKEDNLFAPIASGTSCPDILAVVPCSMGTMSRIANGNSANLIERAADVVLKQRKRLIIVPRETPLHGIHIENMLKLSQNQAVIVPPAPGFYQNPKTIEDLVDFVVGKILDSMDIEHNIYPRWNSSLT